MNKSNILKENFITDFFKKMFRSTGEDKVMKKLKKVPGMAAKIKQAAKNMRALDKDMNKRGYIWKPEKGGWVDKKTGKNPFGEF
jgi:hypothetical protein